MSYSILESKATKQELELAADRRFRFFCCRFPGGDRHVMAYACDEAQGGELRPGLVFAPFANAEKHCLIFSTAVTDRDFCRKMPGSGLELSPMPLESTSENYHASAVNEIIGRLRLRHEKGISCKTVIAKVKMAPLRSAPRDIYMRLCEAYPDAFSFIVNSPESGQWVGASPELLCRIRGNRLTTMALAGTRPSGENGSWDPKNIEEHGIVERFIAETLKKVASKVECSPTYTRQAGPVEHLCCDITAQLPEETSLQSKFSALSSLLDDLSPTPALCGYPRDPAFSDITECENFDRGFYGGYLGRIAENGDCDLYVNLRSMRLNSTSAALIVGGGIMPDSVAAKEWEETERKASTLLGYL